MKERPILFSGAMVRAILDGRKTQTRRVLKPQPLHPHFASRHTLATDDEEMDLFVGSAVLAKPIRCPYGKPGDRLWVRETWGQYRIAPPGIVYHADGELPCGAPERWRPSIHMPRSACRLVLEVTGVRIERLLDISYEDALAEGVADFAAMLMNESSAIGETPEETANRLRWPQRQFESLWSSINGPESWNLNPWVWAVEFRRAAAALGESK